MGRFRAGSPPSAASGRSDYESRVVDQDLGVDCLRWRASGRAASARGLPLSAPAADPLAEALIDDMEAFATIMQDLTWGTQVPLDKATMVSVQVQVPSGGAFSVALDDLTFY